jgi:mono/diheme cytochrome c family protein
MGQQPRKSTAKTQIRARLPLPLLILIITLLLGSGVAVWWLTRGSGAPSAGIAQTVQAADLRITTQIDELAVGPRVIDVQVQDAAGQSVDVGAVRLRFTMTEMDMGQIEVEAQPLGRGRYQARGSFFTMAGHWNVDAMLERAHQPPLQATFAFPIAAPGEASGPLNPLKADGQVIQAGQQVYQANCASCHGASGKGDGPSALGLRPRPSDFSQHMIPGNHTDGQIFLWIKDGVPGTPMPAWGQRLNDEQIWQLVTYLRTFGQNIAAGPATAGPQPTALPAAQATSAPSAPEPLPPMVFVRQSNLWRSDGTGAPPKQLTNLEAGQAAEYPVVAPAGDRIAFVLRGPPPVSATVPISTSALYVMNADGTDLQLLWQPERGTLALPSWTSNGQMLSVGLADILSEPSASVPERLFQIVGVDIATGTRQVILEDARDPTFSRNGAQMAYLHYSKTYAALELQVAAPDGSGARQLTRAGAFSDLYAPRFSPDGAWLVFAAIGGPVTDDQGYPRASSHSPLDQLLGLIEPPTAEAHGAPWDIWVINTDGSGLRRLPNVREDTPMALVAPTGQQIVMMGAGGIYLMKPDGSDLRKIDPVGDHAGLDWADADAVR